LEEKTSTLEELSCSFTIVSSALQGLEYARYNPYHVIMMKSSALMDHRSFFNALRTSGQSANASATGIAIVDQDEEDDFDVTLLHDGQLDIVSVLQEPYTAQQLCMAIEDSLNFQPMDDDN